MVQIGEEQVYTIPLRDAKLAPRWERSKRAVKVMFRFLEQHTKTDRELIRIDPKISEKIWEHGSEKPPRKIRIKAMKFEDGIVEAELATE